MYVYIYIYIYVYIYIYIYPLNSSTIKLEIKPTCVEVLLFISKPKSILLFIYFIQSKFKVCKDRLQHIHINGQ